MTNYRPIQEEAIMTDRVSESPSMATMKRKVAEVIREQAFYDDIDSQIDVPKVAAEITELFEEFLR